MKGADEFGSHFWIITYVERTCGVTVNPVAREMILRKTAKRNMWMYERDFSENIVGVGEVVFLGSG